MRVGFWFTTNRRFHPEDVDNTPFGGCEIEALHVAKQLVRAGHSVLIFANVESHGAVYNQGSFLHYDHLKGVLEKVGLDVLIVVRAHKEVLSPRYSRRWFGDHRPRKIVLWSGDSYDQPSNEILHDTYTLRNIDAIVLKGEWQRQTWLRNLPLVKAEKITVIPKSLHLEWFTPTPSKCAEPRFIYASTAYRGLALFSKIWPKLRERIPNATLDVFSSTNLYLASNPQEAALQQVYRMVEKLDGVTMREPLPQRDFLRELPNYYAMLYPNAWWEETVCGVALEAMASGVPVITSARAGLIETVESGGGFLIHYEPESEQYQKTFLNLSEYLWRKKTEKFLKAESGFLRVREKYSSTRTVTAWLKLLNGLTESRASWLASPADSSSTVGSPSLSSAL